MDMSLVYDWFKQCLEIKAIMDDITTNYVPPRVNVNCKNVIQSGTRKLESNPNKSREIEIPIPSYIKPCNLSDNMPQGLIISMAVRPNQL